MKIKSNLVYSRTSGEIAGFAEMGNMNDESKPFKKNWKENKHQINLTEN